MQALSIPDCERRGRAEYLIVRLEDWIESVTGRLFEGMMHRRSGIINPRKSQEEGKGGNQTEKSKETKPNAVDDGGDERRERWVS